MTTGLVSCMVARCRTAVPAAFVMDPVSVLAVVSIASDRRTDRRCKIPVHSLPP